MSLREKIELLGPWFHNININGVQTAPNHFLGDYPAIKWHNFSHAIPADLRGWTVLDIGCNAGFYSIEMKARGADRVVGIDSNPAYLAQARFAAEQRRAEIEFRQLSVYQVKELGDRFDLVLFMGVIYHLRHPLLALDLIHEHATQELLVCQSLLRGSAAIPVLQPDYEFHDHSCFEQPGYPRMSFVENRYSHDPTNWWIPNSSCLQAMLRSAGYSILQQPEPEVFVCRHVPEKTAAYGEFIG